MKAAKRVLILSLVTVLCLGVMGTGMAAGGNGYGRGGGGGGLGGGPGGGLGGGTGNDTGIRASFRTGIGTGTCLNSDILTAVMESYTGVVSDVCTYGQGIEIATTDSEGVDMTLNIYGIGPIRYWEDVTGEARPSEGETITVDGKWVTFNGTVETSKFIAFSIEIPTSVDENGDILETATIELRDDTTGLPLWRGMGRRW